MALSKMIALEVGNRGNVNRQACGSKTGVRQGIRIILSILGALKIYMTTPYLLSMLPRQKKALLQVAKSKGLSLAAVMRIALDEYLRAETRRARQS